MGKQLIISISREYGSGGHYIAELLAKRFNLPLYDHKLLDHIAEEKGMDLSRLKKYDEGIRKPFVHRQVRGMTNSPEEIVAEMQFQFLRDRAEAGESFVIVGRSAESVLKGCEGLVPFFVLGDRDAKIARIMKVRQMSEEEAKRALLRHDRERKAYHNHYSKMKWGDSRNYAMCINSSVLGVDATADIMESFIREKMKEH
ncbi:MAG: AAA family ATPase [Roseburia sp.]